MSVELYIGQEFDTTYEREALSHFVRSMGNRFGAKDELYVILANYIIGGKPVDLTILKRDAVLVVELKNCIEEFTAHENKAWTTSQGNLIGYNDQNPYRQVGKYRDIWTDFLRENRRYFACLKNIRGNNKPFCYTKGFVAIFPSLNKNYSNKISEKNWWFRLCGLNDLDEKISYETNEIINFSNDELRFIAIELLSMDNPRIIQTTNTENLMEQIRKGADGLTGIIEEKKRKIAQLEQLLREKEEIIAELRRSNDQLTDTLRQYSDKTEQMKEDIRKHDKEIQAADVEKFQLISEYVISNYLKYMDNNKATSLAMLSKKFGMKEDFAMKIINKIAASKKRSYSFEYSPLLQLKMRGTLKVPRIFFI